MQSAAEKRKEKNKSRKRVNSSKIYFCTSKKVLAVLDICELGLNGTWPI